MVKAFLKKHSERATLIGLAIGFLFFVGGGIYLQKQHREEKKEVDKPKIQKVELTVRSQTQGSRKKEEGSADPQVISAFFLKPSPDELLEQLSELETVREDVAQKKFINMRVIWPVYFFDKQEKDGAVTAIFDVSEDGFGVIIESDINLSRFPELFELEQGVKLWIGGEIIGVDLSGTGTIYLNIEQVDLSAEGPLARMKAQSPR